MTPDKIKRKLTAILSADVKGYSRLMGEDEEWTLRTLNTYKEVMRSLVQQHRGRVVSTPGDNVLDEFASVVNAVQCGVEIQQVLRAKNAMIPENRRVEFRIGINLGDVIEEGDSIYGDGVNIAARMESLAEAGGICISGSAYEQIENKLPLRYDYLGEHEVKNIAKPVRVYKAQIEPEAAPSRRPVEVASRDKTAFPLPDKPSIAVLPFVNMSRDPEQEFFSDGITEDLITALSRVKGLRVPARTSSSAFKGKNEDIRRIGQLLSVETVLEGSVRKSGNRLRITAQLIKVADGFHLWSEHYDREMKDVFDIQDDITSAIVNALEVQLVSQPAAPLVKRATENTEAYQLYLKGREFWKQRGLGLKKALHYFELALLEDPNYSLAHAGAADTYGLLGFYDLLPCRDALAKGKAAAEAALALDAQSAEVHNSLAFVKMFYELDLLGAEKEFLRALELNPKYTPARYWYASCLLFLGRGEEAIAQEFRSIETEPLSVFTNAHVGWTYVSMRRFEEAIPPLRKCLELNSNFALVRWVLGQAYLFSGRPELALAELQKAVDLSGRIPMMLATFACALVVAGLRSQALELLRELRDRSIPVPVRSFYLAEIHAVLGEKERAWECLQKAWEERDFWLLWLQADATLDSLHEDPRFAELVRRIRFEG